MIRFPRSLTAVLLGVIGAALLQFIPNSERPPEVRPLGVASSKTPASSGFAARVAEVINTCAEAVQTAFQSPAERAQKTANTMLLAEEVVVLGAANQPAQHLSAGTPVQLLANNGRFLQVKHQNSVLTIPRSTVISGVLRTDRLNLVK